MATSKIGWDAFAVLQASSGGKEWTVQRHRDTGAFRCNCPSFIFCKGVPRTCKHCRRCEQELAAEKFKGTATAATVLTQPTVNPLMLEASVMFDAMVQAAQAKVAGTTDLRTRIGAASSKVMVETLMAKLALFNPAAALKPAAATPGLTRRITFDD